MRKICVRLCVHVFFCVWLRGHVFVCVCDCVCMHLCVWLRGHVFVWVCARVCKFEICVEGGIKEDCVCERKREWDKERDREKRGRDILHSNLTNKVFFVQCIYFVAWHQFQSHSNLRMQQRGHVRSILKTFTLSKLFNLKIPTGKFEKYFFMPKCFFST